MSFPFRLFQRSSLFTQCEECKLAVDLSNAGACRECRRILCNTHLYGSFFQRLKVDFGSPALCVRCRRNERSATHGG